MIRTILTALAVFCFLLAVLFVGGVITISHGAVLVPLGLAFFAAAHL